MYVPSPPSLRRVPHHPPLFIDVRCLLRVMFSGPTAWGDVLSAWKRLTTWDAIGQQHQRNPL